MIVLQVLGAVLGVLQAGLAIEDHAHIIVACAARLLARPI